MRLSRFEWGCIVVIALAALLRVTFLLQPNFIWDSAWFLMLARSFGASHTFLIRWSDPSAPQYSGYWPPLFPIFASPFVAVFGASYRTLVLASDVAAGLLVAATFFATRDLFDRTKAFAAAAIVAASPAFYASDAQGMSESLVGLTVLLTVWAFLRSLDRPIWLPVAAVFAALAYLSKASLGIPFVAIGIAAIGAWRIRVRGWRTVARSPIDLSVAAAGLLILAALALTRSEKIGGLGLGVIEPLARSVRTADCGYLVQDITGAPQPWFHLVGAECWLAAIPLKLLFVAAFLIVTTLPLSLRIPQLLKQPRSERTDALWLAVLLPLLAGSVFTATFFFTEKRSFVDFDNIRYLTPAIVPFVWLLLPMWSFEEEPEAANAEVRRHHATWYWIAVSALALLFLLNPLTGTESLPRFFALTALALVPLAISWYARTTQYELSERRVGRDIERRYVRGRTKLAERRMAALTAVLLVFGGWYYSSWYALIGFALLVVLATPSTTRRVVAMSILLLASAAPAAHNEFPAEAAAHALAKLPKGTLVGMGDIIVYPAAVAPDNARVTMVDPDAGPIPSDVNVLVMQSEQASRHYDNFTLVRSWNYAFTFSPTLAARVWFEKNVLGEDFDFQQVRAISIYVRDGSGIEKDLSR